MGDFHVVPCACVFACVCACIGVFASVCVSTTHAASCSRASWLRRMPCMRESGGAPSITTMLNTALRNRRSAARAILCNECGRMTTKRQPSSAHGAGARVRLASIHATQAPVASMWLTTPCMMVVLPAARGPLISVMRPRGIPPPRVLSSSGMPTGHGRDEAVLPLRSAMASRRARSLETDGGES